MRAVRPVLIVLAVLCAIAAGFHYVMNPEKTTLGADARAGAPEWTARHRQWGQCRKWALRDSNPRPMDYESTALTN